MKTLSEVLREADPLGPLGNDARRPSQERRRPRPTVVEHAGVVENLPKRRAAMAAIAAFVVIGTAAIIFNWPYPMDVVAAVRFEVRLAEENPAPGLRELAVPGTERKIYVHREAVIVNNDIARAQVAQGDGTPPVFSVDVTFTAEGAAKIRRATRSHIGRPVAILVDGDVVIAPVVRAAVGTSASINGNYSRADAERIVAGILGR